MYDSFLLIYFYAYAYAFICIYAYIHLDFADKHLQIVKEAMANMRNNNDVAKFLDAMLSNTFDRSISLKSSAKHNANCRSRPKWYDRALTEKIYQAIQAGGHMHINACRDYRALRHSRQRDFHCDCLNELQTAMANGKKNMWKKRFANLTQLPQLGELYDHFKRFAAPSSVDCFDDEYEKWQLNILTISNHL